MVVSVLLLGPIVTRKGLNTYYGVGGKTPKIYQAYIAFLLTWLIFLIAQHWRCEVMLVYQTVNMAAAMRCFQTSLSFLALYTTYICSFKSGFLQLLSEITANESLSGCRECRLRTRYTGLQWLDAFLTATVVFFWPICQGNMGPLSLYGLSFAGGIVAMWVLAAMRIYRTVSFLNSTAM